MANITGYFMEPQNFSVNDGNGIRTIIFLAGCPLRCKWCSNPESHVNISGLEACKRNKLIYRYSTSDILSIIEKQRIFYRYSGGGVTFSGGEATLQQDILRELVYKLYDKGVNLAIETSGYFKFDEVKDILKKLNLIFIDIKHMDDEEHKFFTGVSNKKILSNIKSVNELNVPMVIRIPVIVGVNSDMENIIKTAKFVRENIREPKIELLPYHSFGDEKYEILEKEKPSRDYKTPLSKYLGELVKAIRNEGVKVVSYK
ncbi:glycyl-radical enzyme activating protein [Clostridium sp. D2Q-14]|uniref:glycyl-radical enzyme activating protein n=1 Tax=Anaeromonas gelatinilytica TaxID=2683194 RepID=UPI00193B0027|nr:glycyl-radical enzyme activating protein [Anaeromonas gelatinilytica]MBS4536472.1 glycyl-radical enzyme activating protein [Anaeromonas gelatinilytica]